MYDKAIQYKISLSISSYYILITILIEQLYYSPYKCGEARKNNKKSQRPQGTPFHHSALSVTPRPSKKQLLPNSEK